MTAKSPKTSPTTETILSGSEISNGVHTIQVEATDSLGQVVDSIPATIKVDRSPPRVSVRVNGSSVTVRVSDGAKGQISGVDAGSVHVNFGVGARHGSAHGRTVLAHRYSAGGSYTITVTASDRAGNRVERAPAGDGRVRRRRHRPARCPRSARRGAARRSLHARLRLSGPRDLWAGGGGFGGGHRVCRSCLGRTGRRRHDRRGDLGERTLRRVPDAVRRTSSKTTALPAAIPNPRVPVARGASSATTAIPANWRSSPTAPRWR